MQFVEYYINRLYEDAFLDLITEEDIRDSRGGALTLDDNELEFFNRVAQVARERNIPPPGRAQLFTHLLTLMPDPYIKDSVELSVKGKGRGPRRNLPPIPFDMDNLRSKFSAAGYDTSKPIKVTPRTVERWFQRGDASGIYRIYPDSRVTLVKPNEEAYEEFKTQIEEDIANVVGHRFGVIIRVDPRGGLRHQIIKTRSTVRPVTEEEIDDAMQNARFYLLRRAGVMLNGKLAIRDKAWRRQTIGAAVKKPAIQYFSDLKQRLGAIRHQIDKGERGEEILPKDFANQNTDLTFARRVTFAKHADKVGHRVPPWHEI